MKKVLQREIKKINKNDQKILNKTRYNNFCVKFNKNKNFDNSFKDDNNFLKKKNKTIFIEFNSNNSTINNISFNNIISIKNNNNSFYNTNYKNNYKKNNFSLSEKTNNIKKNNKNNKNNFNKTTNFFINNNNNKNIQKKILNTKNNQLKKNKSKDLTRASIKINLNDIIKEIKINNYLSKDKNKNYCFNNDDDSDKENINSNINRKIINFKDYKTNEIKSSNYNYNLNKNFSIDKKIINVDKENEFNNILFNKEYLNEFPFETENFNDLNSIVKKLKLDEILIKSNSIFNIFNNKIRNNYNKLFEKKFQLFKKIEIKNFFSSINNSSGHSKYKSSGKKKNYSFSTQANSSFKKVNYVN